MIEIIERLAAAGFEALPSGMERHVVLVRDEFAALVEKRETGFGGIGSTGLVTERGLAMLVWRGEQAFFVLKGSEQPATEDQVAELRRFAADLAACLSPAQG
ncbi:MAG: hypothetical protein U0Q16_11960 [Bryobacteraceae bacterium]